MTPYSTRALLRSVALCALIASATAHAQPIVGNPSSNQTITQPTGTSLSVNTLRVQDLSRTYYADKYCTTPGVLDDSCIRNAINALPAESTVFIPAGRYNINTKIVIGKSIALAGASRASTILVGQTTGDALIQVDANPNGIGVFEIRDLTMTTAVNRVWGWAINIRNSNISNPPNGPFNVSLRNLRITADPGKVQADGIYVQNGYYYTIEDVDIGSINGTAVAFLGEWIDKDHHTSIGSIYIHNLRVTTGARIGGSLFIGAYVGGVYGSQVTLEENASVHLRVEPGPLPAGAGLEAIPQNLFFDQLIADFGKRNAYINSAMSVYFTNSWFTSATDSEGILIDGTIGSNLEARDIRVNSSRIIYNLFDGVRLLAGKQVWIDGCLVDANGRGGTAYGVHVGAGVTDFHVHNSQFFRHQTTPTHQNSVRVDPGASDRYTVVGNDLSGYKAGGAAISDGGTGARKIIANNLTF